MNLKIVFFTLLAAVLIGVSSCRKDSVIGSDLLGNEDLSVDFTDTISVKAMTVRGDSVLTYRTGTGAQTFMMGTIDEPFFGKTSSDLYVGARQLVDPIFKDAVMDSIVLIIKLDTIGNYGSDMESHDIAVNQISEKMIDLDSIYSSEIFDYDMMPLGSQSYMRITGIDSVWINDYINDDTIKVEPSLRIRLDDNFGQMLLDNEDIASSDSAFVENIFGFHLSTETINSMFGVDLSVTQSTVGANRLSIFYVDTLGEDTRKRFDYLIGGIRHSEFVHDYTGSVVEDFLNDTDMGDSLLFIQGMAGVRTSIDLSGVRDFSDRLLNYAELEFTLAELMPDDLELYHPLSNLVASFEGENGRQIIEDVNLSANPSFGIGNIELLFGGNLELVTDDQGAIIMKYKMSITNHVNQLMSDSTMDANLILSALGTSENPARSIIFGSGHSTYPLKLKLAFTNP